MQPSTIELIATVLFALAVLHTFAASKIERLAHHYPEGSIGENFFHFMGEVEVVFGLWAAILLVFYTLFEGFAIYDEHHHAVGGAIHWLESLNFTEPAFVFVIMCIAATRPLIIFAENCIKGFAKILPLPGKMPFYCATLILGPLLGSFITEPAAMTVTALILLDYFYTGKMSAKFKYATVGLLFVNVSIGGTLTHFAAPPVLMVAAKYGWGMTHMLGSFGYKAAIAIILCTVATAFVFKSELTGQLRLKSKEKSEMIPPTWITLIHLVFLAAVVYTSHHMVFFLGVFLFFLGFVAVTKEYQVEPKLRESLLVGFFLGGLVVLGSMQSWWLKSLLTSMEDLTLFIGATGLTAITDNAALTYLGSLVQLTESQKYNLVAGAVAGGGLTVIANAPNPAGFGILKKAFGGSGINPLGLLAGAALPTLVACLCLQLLPNLTGNSAIADGGGHHGKSQIEETLHDGEKSGH